MARLNRRGRYYNYPNLRANMSQPRPVSSAVPAHVEPAATAQELHAMNEIPEREKADTARVTYENANRQNTQPDTAESCRIRFFNAAAGYGGLEIRVADQLMSKNLSFGKETDYKDVPDGFQQVTVTMVQEPEAVLLNKRLPFRNCMNTTAAIMNTSTGIEIMMINDTGCNLTEENRACFRVVNLSYTSPPLDIILENGNPVFEDVRFKHVTEYKQAIPGEYNMDVMLARTAETVKSNTVDIIMPEVPQDEGGYPGEVEKAYAYFFEEFEDGKRYTAYIIGNKDYEPTLRVETLEERE